MNMFCMEIEWFNFAVKHEIYMSVEQRVETTGEGKVTTQQNEQTMEISIIPAKRKHPGNFSDPIILTL